jgi:purine-binding chemotaxis protein CheW
MNHPEQAGAAPAETIQMCSLRTGLGLFGIEPTKIREVLGAIAPQRVPLAPAYIDGIVAYRGEVLTTVGLRALLGLESSAKLDCILVLEEEPDDELFGLAVDSVGGVVDMPRNALEPIPSTRDARGTALFSRAYRTDSGLMVQLDPHLLRPSRLAPGDLLGPAIPESNGGRR